MRRLRENKNTEILNHLASRISYDEFLQRNIFRLIKIVKENRFKSPELDEALLEYLGNSDGIKPIVLLEYLALNNLDVSMKISKHSLPKILSNPVSGCT